MLFDLLRAQLGEVKKELSPNNWYQHVATYAEQKKAKQKLHTLVDVAEDGPLKDMQEIEETSPEFNAKVDTMMLSEHLKTKCMQANGAFTKAGQLLMQSHSCIAKDFLLAESFIDALTHIPENTQDENEMLGKKVQSMTIRIEELEMEKKILINSAQRRKEAIREHLSERFKQENLSRFYGGLVANWAFQSQREQVFHLRESKSSLELELASMSAKYQTTLKEYSEASSAWGHERSELMASLAELREVMEAQKQEAEKALSEASSHAEDQASYIAALAKERVLLQKQITEFEQKTTQLQEDIKSVNDELEAKVTELQETRATLLREECEVARLREEKAKQQETITELQEETRSLKSTFSSWIVAQRSRAKQRLDRMFALTPPSILRWAFGSWARIMPELRLEQSLDDFTMSFARTAFALADLEGAVTSGRFQGKSVLFDLLKGTNLEEQVKLLLEELDGSVDQWTMIFKTKVGEYEISSAAPDWEVPEYKFFYGGREHLNQIPKSGSLRGEKAQDAEDAPQLQLAMPVDIMPVLRAAEAAIRTLAVESDSPPPSPWRDPTLDYTASEFFRKRATNKKLQDTANSLLQVAAALKKGPQARRNRMNAALATLQKVSYEAEGEQTVRSKVTKFPKYPMPGTPPHGNRKPLPPPMITNEALQRRASNFAPPPPTNLHPLDRRPLRRIVSAAIF